MAIPECSADSCPGFDRLTSLDLFNVGGVITQLPCSNLQQLVLRGGSVQLGPAAAAGGDQSGGILASCPHLTNLCMDWCYLSDGLSALEAVPGLRHLEAYASAAEQVPGAALPGSSDANPKVELPDHLLQQVVQLTFLHLGGCLTITAQSLQHLTVPAAPAGVEPCSPHTTPHPQPQHSAWLQHAHSAAHIEPA